MFLRLGGSDGVDLGGQEPGAAQRAGQPHHLSEPVGRVLSPADQLQEAVHAEQVATGNQSPLQAAENANIGYMYVHVHVHVHVHLFI